MDPENIYQAPQSETITAETKLTEAEQTRQEHLKHETSLKSVGILFYLGALAAILIGIFSFTGGGTYEGLIMVALIALGIFQFWAAFHIRKLNKVAKIPCVILAAIGLFNFPLGTALNGYILYLILSIKGQTILSEEYQEVIKQTPHIKYKTPLYLWIILGIIIVLLIAAVIGFTAT